MSFRVNVGPHLELLPQVYYLSRSHDRCQLHTYAHFPTGFESRMPSQPSVQELQQPTSVKDALALQQRDYDCTSCRVMGKTCTALLAVLRTSN